MTDIKRKRVMGPMPGRSLCRVAGPALFLLLGCLVEAGIPLAKVVKLRWDPASLPGGSNAVYTVYKSTSLGTVWSPWKKTTITPWPRTNVAIVVLPGTYRFRLTLTDRLEESQASNTITNIVK